MMIKRAILVVTALTAAGCTTVPDPHIIPVGSTTPSDLDTCINDAFTSMAGKWHMRFSVSGPDGTVSQSQPTTLAAIGARPLPNPSSQ